MKKQGSRRSVRGVPTSRSTFDLPEDTRNKLRTLAAAKGSTLNEIIRRLIDVASMPDGSKGERLCVCNGERAIVAVIAM